MNAKYDIYLSNTAITQGFRLSQPPVRDSAPLVAARFSTGAQGQSDLDLLKTASQDSFEGGMFQRDWEDTQKAARVMGVFNKYDKMLYPTIPRGSLTNVSAGYGPLCKAESPNMSFIAYGLFSAGNYLGSLRQITPGGGYTTITLPAALASNTGSFITGMCFHKNYLFVARQSSSGSSTNSYRYDVSAGTWQDLGGAFVKPFTLLGNLYGINHLSEIFSITNETIAGSATFTFLARAGLNNWSTGNIPLDGQEFNGAAYIAKPEGIFRFNGTTAIKVLNHYTKQLHVWNGAIYFFSGNWLYKFDGTTITRLQFFGNSELADPAGDPGATMSLASNQDYLFVETVVFSSGYATNDKIDASAAGYKRIYAYDGVGFFLWFEQAVELGIAYNPALVSVYNSLFDIFGNTEVGGYQTKYASFDLTSQFDSADVTTASKLEYTISEFTDGFPNINKCLAAVGVDYADLDPDDVISIRYQYYNGRAWSDWQFVPDVTVDTLNEGEITDSSVMLFKRLRVAVSVALSNGSTTKLRGGFHRYTLQPRPRSRWQLTLMVQGNGKTKDLQNTTIADDSNYLAGVVMDAVNSKLPQFLFTLDYGLVKTTVNDAATSFIVKGRFNMRPPMDNEWPLVAVHNDDDAWEILQVLNVSYDDVTDQTTIFIKERDYLGIPPAQISAGAEVRPCFRVYVTRLLRDATKLSNETYNEQSTTGESQLLREMMIEATEV